MKITFTAKTTQDTIRTGEAIGCVLKAGDVVALCGGLGAGKTTLTKGIARALGVEDDVTSPTFCIVSEYEGRLPLRHIDLYRLSGIEDFLDIGGDQLFWQEGVCVLEWSERIKAALPPNALQVRMAIERGGGRTIVVDNLSEQTSDALAKIASHTAVSTGSDSEYAVEDTQAGAGGIS